MGTLILKNYILKLSKFFKKRLFSVAATLDSKDKTTIFSSYKVLPSVLKSFLENEGKSFINTNEIHLLEKYFEPVNKVKCHYNFVIDEVIAKEIVNKILSSTKYKGSIIIEGNPGLGLITLNLINSGIPHLYVCDSSKLKSVSLNQILQKYPDKLTYINTNIIKNSDALVLLAFDEAVKRDLCVTFIMITSNYLFLRFLVLVFLKNGLWRKKFEIYIVLNSAMLDSLNNFNPVQLKFLYYCGFNLLFTTEEIGRYPCCAFLPPLKSNENDYLLLKLSLNPLLSVYFEENELMDYIIFITILGSKSRNLIIQTLEKWLPNCGPYLINKGISVTNKVKDLSFKESILLFKIFKECEGYNNFKLCISHAFEEIVVE